MSKNHIALNAYLMDSVFIDKVFGEDFSEECLLKEELKQIWNYIQLRKVDLIWKRSMKILSERQLQCFYLRYYFNLPEGKIANILNISQPLVHLNLKEGEHKLRHCLGGMPMKGERQIKQRMGELVSTMNSLGNSEEDKMIKQQILGALDFASWVLGSEAKSIIDTETADLEKLLEKKEENNASQ